MTALDASQGAGFRILTEPVTSPTLAAKILALLLKYPLAQWYQYDAAGDDASRLGAEIAFGEQLAARYYFDKADVVVSLDADFLWTGPAAVRHARDFSSRRKVTHDHVEMSRLYVAESMPSVTGSAADHRASIKASQVDGLARALAQRLGVPGVGGDAHVSDEWLRAVVDDLEHHRGSSVVVAGLNQPPAVHALAHAINAALGNIGVTVDYAQTAEAVPANYTESLETLVTEMKAGQVNFLVVLGGNPAFTAPADLDFAGGIKQVDTSVYVGLHPDETASLVTWNVPAAHELESWGDARAFDGTASIIQPLINPLYGGRTSQEIVDLLAGTPSKPYDAVRAYWKTQHTDADFEKWWRRALHEGVVEGTAFPAKIVALAVDFASKLPSAKAEGGSGFEVNFRPDPTIWDGRYANNGWLQEAPKPITKLTWENTAIIAPATAERLNVKDGDFLTLTYKGKSVEAPAFTLPGHPVESVTVHLGYGRTKTGRVGTDAGFNAYTLRTSESPWYAAGLTAQKSRGHTKLANTQRHHGMEGRDIIREASLASYKADPHLFSHIGHHGDGPAPNFYPKHAPGPYSWGMSIDLASCIGCGACTVACVAENNIPVVGKEQVAIGREMHWIRVDMYFGGNDLANPDILHQPVPCMHCENAPCEPVCPVHATSHSAEGLNEMTYNRCVGTRYCANNCPYKVRRFNFYEFNDRQTDVLKLQRNPNVTVRTRGVMEKCSYCNQRISAARITAKKENRPIADGEIVTACQQACPTQAITFGDQADPNSKVAKLKAEPTNYSLLEELNTFPRTTYLAKLRNAHPSLDRSAPGGHGTESRETQPESHPEPQAESSETHS